MKKYTLLLIGGLCLFPYSTEAFGPFKKKSSQTQEQINGNQSPNKKQPGPLSKLIRSAGCKKALFQSGNGKKCSSPTVYNAVKKACGGVAPPSCEWGYEAHYNKFIHSQERSKKQGRSQQHDPEQGGPQRGYSEEQKNEWNQQYREESDQYKDRLPYSVRKKMSPTQKRVFRVDPQQGGKPVQYDENDNETNKAAFAAAYEPRKR